MNQEINIKKIPQYQLDRLSKPLIEAVSKYFENPKVQKEFEAWQQASQYISHNVTACDRARKGADHSE